MAVGDNTRRDLTQNLDSHMGKLLRINPNDSAPSDNPYAGIQHSAQKQQV